MDLSFLSPLYDRPGPWATVYFDPPMTTEDAASHRELAARAAAEQLDALGADDATCQAVRAQLSALSVPSAVFATEGEVVLDVPLAKPPDRTYADWGTLPHTGPLLEFAQESVSCLVARIDRMGADIELRTVTGTRDVGRVDGEDWPVRQVAIGDWSESHFEQSVQDTWRRNAALVADRLASVQEEIDADVVVLAGERRQCHTVRDRLPQRVRERTVEAEHGKRAPALSEAAGERMLDKEVAEAAAARARRHTADIMEAFYAGRSPEAAASGGGRSLAAVDGVPALADAAREHRIAALLLRTDGPDRGRQVWVGPEPDQIGARRNDVRALGASDPFPARADDALIRAAARTGAEAVALRPADVEPALPAGGIGAVLRWPTTVG
ncbi:baeRF2 domain-containing protein [Streptomyces apocyni]|uniref:baeRF2 domain-containing protein n=1 Tax=Streptomyces apocyni TaxID=2654677 RepID=UPI0012EA2BA1|nr:Vms1/Ankzf1 family peptidyl-tRNA hydrolase [Streptomyces apocyni]